MADTDLLQAAAPDFTAQDWRVLSYIDQRFWETGQIPTEEKIARDLNIDPGTVAVYLGNQTPKSQKFLNTLKARGIDVSRLISEEYTAKKLLTPKQILLANLLMNPLDKQTTREKLKLAQVSQQQYNAWMNDQVFTDYLTKRAKVLFGAADSKALTTLLNKMEKGDMKALQLFLEMRDLYTPKRTLNIDVNLLITRIIEVVSRYVEPSTLTLIAQDLETIDESFGSRELSPVEIEEKAASISKQAEPQTEPASLSPAQTPQEAPSQPETPAKVNMPPPTPKAPTEPLKQQGAPLFFGNPGNAGGF